MLRSIDRFVDLSDVRQHLAPFYSSMGRPSIDPELMIRILLVGYCMGIRSERRLCEEVHLNLAYRWFCRLGLKARQRQAMFCMLIVTDDFPTPSVLSVARSKPPSWSEAFHRSSLGL
jgi:transposase